MCGSASAQFVNDYQAAQTNIESDIATAHGLLRCLKTARVQAGMACLANKHVEIHRPSVVTIRLWLSISKIATKLCKGADLREVAFAKMYDASVSSTWKVDLPAARLSLAPILV